MSQFFLYPNFFFGTLAITLVPPQSAETMYILHVPGIFRVGTYLVFLKFSLINGIILSAILFLILVSRNEILSIIFAQHRFLGKKGGGSSG